MRQIQTGFSSYPRRSAFTGGLFHTAANVCVPVAQPRVDLVAQQLPINRHAHIARSSSRGIAFDRCRCAPGCDSSRGQRESGFLRSSRIHRSVFWWLLFEAEERQPEERRRATVMRISPASFPRLPEPESWITMSNSIRRLHRFRRCQNIKPMPVKCLRPIGLKSVESA